MPRKGSTHWAYQTAQSRGYRSGSEAELKKSLVTLGNKLGATVEYEAEKLSYTKPVTIHTYLPDFRVVTASGTLLYLECKGRFLSDDRKKHLLVKEQRPDIEIRFIFDNPYDFLSPKRTAIQEKAYRAALAEAKRKGKKRPLVREVLPKKERYDMWCDKHGFKWCAASDTETLEAWLNE